MAGVRLTDPLEQELLDKSKIQQLSVDDLRTLSPAVTRQLDRLSRITDKIYVHIDMDVLDPREVEGHQNKVPNGPSSAELAKLFEMIFARYPEGRGHRLCDDSRARRGRPVDRGAESHDSGRGEGAAGSTVGCWSPGSLDPGLPAGSNPSGVLWRRSLGVTFPRPAEPLWRAIAWIIVLFTAVAMFQWSASADDATLAWWSRVVASPAVRASVRPALAFKRPARSVESAHGRARADEVCPVWS